ncbi:MAG: hypothetical protein Q7R69_01495 [bacterium]|nr:hypothetical protein [bacterium]
MKKTHLLGMLFYSALFLTGCAAGPNTAAHIVASDGSLAGFWLGLWHGMIAPITLVISLFSNNVGFYEVHNSGGWYNFGFVLGVVILFSGREVAPSQRS